MVLSECCPCTSYSLQNLFVISLLLSHMPGTQLPKETEMQQPVVLPWESGDRQLTDRTDYINIRLKRKRKKKEEICCSAAGQEGREKGENT